MSTSSKLFVSAANGQLGRLVVDVLLETTPPDAIVAGVRDLTKAGAILDKGVELRIADYSRPESLAEAFVGVDRLLLISGSEVGQRNLQHRNAINAARAAGVGLIAYTSILHADVSPLVLADEHRDTEDALAESGVPFVLLRNGWYSEVYTWRITSALKQGVFSGAAGEGRISAAARADYARAAATVLAGGDHAGRIYELAGDTSFTLADFAAAVARSTGLDLPYRNFEPQDLRSAMLAAGAPEAVALIVSDTDAGVAKGALFDEGGALSRLIGRPTTPFEDAVKSFLSGESVEPVSGH